MLYLYLQKVQFVFFMFFSEIKDLKQERWTYLVPPLHLQGEISGSVPWDMHIQHSMGLSGGEEESRGFVSDSSIWGG